MSVKKYCYCDNNCKYETLDKEEILAAIAQAVETGIIGECDTGFITTIKTITGEPLKFFVGEQSEYEALTEEQRENLFAIITNDTTKEGIQNTLDELLAAASDQTKFNADITEGNIVIKKAECDANGKELANNYKYLGEIVGNDARWLDVAPYDKTSETINLDLLFMSFHTGTYGIRPTKIANGYILGLPADIPCKDYAAKLTIECAPNAAIQTLEIGTNDTTQLDKMLIYRRQASVKSYKATWGAWVRYVSVEELISGEVKVTEAAHATNADYAKHATKAMSADKATAAENANTIKPPTVNTATMSYEGDTTELDIELENGKTYIFSLLHQFSFVAAATFVLHIPDEDRVRAFEDKYTLIDSDDNAYYAYSNVVSLMSTDSNGICWVRLRYVINGTSKKLYLEEYNSSDNTWGRFTSGFANYEMDLKYSAIATM